MTKYMVLYTAPQSAESAMQDSSPESAAEGMKVWMDWAEKAGDGIVDLGTPLGGGKEIGTSGVSDSAADVAGYTILQADSMDAALALLEGHPHLMMPGASIQVYEALDIPGM
ncbi:hypothetical protein HP499_06685 [Paenarthrobacter sp. CM16]|jgi:hypothetical protein|uniref:hypothetical protein n=1 Tax=Paenarthrobacter sp. CM16 TaxID=2738447 RepID=UPI0015549A1F|nr:hypothetical protein [Paenarthrobacter sp. CM16]NQD87490.1 hypothetical protein [Paenarthrobacter sp. CM16]